MRVLLLTQFYPPIRGGIEHHVQNLGANLAQRGHEVLVVTTWHKNLAEFEMDGMVRVRRIHGTMERISGLFSGDRHHSPPFPDPEMVVQLRKIISIEKPEIIHAHNWMIHSYLPLKPWNNAKLVMTLHDSEMTCVQMRMMYMDQDLCSGAGVFKCVKCAVHHFGVTKGIVTFVSNTIMSSVERNQVDLFLPVSRAIAKSNNLEGSDARYEVVANFVPDNIAVVDDDTVLDTRIAVLPDEGFILQVGDLSRDKGVFILLKAYCQLESPPPLVLIGRTLQDSPSELPNGVTILNDLPHSVVMQAWKRCMFGVAPSLCLDASPTVTLEAMAVGKPIIASRIGGFVDQITNGETGLLVEPGNVDQLNSAMSLLISDKALRGKMGASAKLKVVDFQSNSIVNQIETLYSNLLK